MHPKPDSHGALLLAEAIRQAYARGQCDYSMEPLVRCGQDGKPVGRVQAGDAVIFCCRRGEREIELTEAFTDLDFAPFERPLIPDLNFIILTLYHEKFKDLPVAFLPSQISSTLGEALSQADRSQMRCSESEKFAHVTFFLNGGRNQAFPGEVDVRIPSPKGIPFEQVPELSLPAVADEVIGGIEKGLDCIVTNFANGDVIGHTANTAAKIQCAEAVDHHLGRVVAAAESAGYAVLVTADHGNLEELFTPEGKPHVAHTANPVPFIAIDPLSDTPVLPRSGSLADLAPTILSILGLPAPASMTGSPLASQHAWGPGRKVLLIILDGWGLGRDDETNPIHTARTPFWDGLVHRCPPAYLLASGEAVGLQAGKPGNSEAGHMNIGAGRVVAQDDVRLEQALQDGSFSTNPVFVQALEQVRQWGTRLHLIGLLTEKSSHGAIDYPLALLKLARDMDLKQAYLHLILDGRSTEPGSAPALLEKLENLMAEAGCGQVAGSVGRGIALDRDGNYAKIRRAYMALTAGEGVPYGG